MSLNHMQATVHFMVRVWNDEGKICYESVFINILCLPELILDLPSGQRPTYDWIAESFSEYLDSYLPALLPEELEVCKDPIICEIIADFKIEGYFDYFSGEYDEDYDYEIQQWSCDLEQNQAM